jgi:hypothetical protein
VAAFVAYENIRMVAGEAAEQVGGLVAAITTSI